jgi:hypothetical protein
MSDETREVIDRFHVALNSHDTDALARLVHEGCVFETTDPPDGTRHAGRDAVLGRARSSLTSRRRRGPRWRRP